MFVCLRYHQTPTDTLSLRTGCISLWSFPVPHHLCKGAALFSSVSHPPTRTTSPPNYYASGTLLLRKSFMALEVSVIPSFASSTVALESSLVLSFLPSMCQFPWGIWAFSLVPTVFSSGGSAYWSSTEADQQCLLPLSRLFAKSLQVNNPMTINHLCVFFLPSLPPPLRSD